MELYIKDLSRTIGKQKILKEINIHFKGPGLICIVGPSGSGKSTLLNLIGGLDSATGGQIILNGINITNLKGNELEWYRNHQLGFIFQDFFLIKHLDVLGNIMLSSLMGGTKKDVATSKAKELMTRLGLNGKEHNYPHQLSGGEKQRVAIGRALINEPDILLADEPTGNLDHQNSLTVFQMLKEIAKERLVVIVTHDLEMAQLYSDKIYTMSDGKIINQDYLSTLESKVTKIPNRNISLNLKTSFILAYRHLSSKKKRLLSIVISLVISLTFLSLLLSLKTGTEKMVNNYYETNYNINLVKVNEKSSLTIDNYMYYSNFIDDEKITKIKDEAHVKDVVVNYQDIFGTITLDFNGQTYDDYGYEVFNMDDYFMNRFQKFNIIGNIPSNDHEIILSIDVAKKFNEKQPESLLGKEMMISTGNETVKVVGLSKFPFSFYSSNLIKELLTSISYNHMNLFAVSYDKYKDLYIEKATKGSLDSSYQLPFIIKETKDVSVQLMSGSFPIEDDEVVMSTHLFTTLTSSSDYSLTTTNQIYLINPLFGHQKLVKIKGLFQSDEDIIVPHQTTLTNLTKPNGTSIDVYVDHYKNISEVTQKIDLLNLQYDISGLKAINGLKNTLSLLEITLGIFIGITSLISIIIIFSIVSTNAQERINEIGILKALGANKRNILHLFIIEALITSIIAIFITLILILVLYPIGNDLFHTYSNMNDQLFTFSIKNIILLYLLCNLVTICSSLIPSYHASRLKPVDALRK